MSLLLCVCVRDKHLVDTCLFFLRIKTLLVFSVLVDKAAFFPVAACVPGLNSRSPLSETKSTSSSLSALSDSLNSSEGGDLTHANEELRGLLALPSSAGSQSSSGSHSGSGTEDKPDKGRKLWPSRHTFFLFISQKKIKSQSAFS